MLSSEMKNSNKTKSKELNYDNNYGFYIDNIDPNERVDWRKVPSMTQYFNHKEELNNDIIVIDEMLIPYKNNKKSRYFPFDPKYDIIYNNIIDQQKIFWAHNEVSLSHNDKLAWNRMTQERRNKIIMPLVFFRNADGYFSDEISNLAEVFQSPIIKSVYRFQSSMEDTHAFFYSIMFDSLIEDEELKRKLDDSFDDFPTVKRISEWFNKWVKNAKTISHQVAAMTVFEGMFFQGKFSNIIWFCSDDCMNLKPLEFGNNQIRRDENRHVINGFDIYWLLENKLKEEIILEMILEAVDIEIECQREILKDPEPRMNIDSMIEFLHYYADFLLIGFGNKPYYGVEESPFTFMERDELYTKYAQFEERNDNYNVFRENKDNEFSLYSDNEKWDDESESLSNWNIETLCE